MTTTETSGGAVTAAPRSALKRWAGRLGPYVVAAVAIAAILQRYSIDEIRAEIARGNALPLFPIALVTYTLSLLFVAAADRLVLSGLAGESAPAYAAVVKGKAASVLLHVVHYALGQGAYGTWLARRMGLRIGRAGGLLAYIVAAELCSVCVFALLVVAIGRPNVPTTLVFTVATIAAGLIAFALVAPMLPLRRIPLLETWLETSRTRTLAQIGVRLFQHSCTTGGAWVAARAFGLEIPLSVMLSYMPIILMIGSLPVNVAGFGAVQGAWLLLEPWASGERILAFSLVWQLASAVALVFRGLPFIRGVMDDIRTGAVPTVPTESSDAEPHAGPEASPRST